MRQGDSFQTSFEKSLIWAKNKESAASFQYIWIAVNLAYNKKLYETS